MGYLVFFVVFFIYLKTLTGTVNFRDCGELIRAISHLAVVHPPGYPLFCLASKLFTMLPIGNIAFKINLLSGLAAAAAATSIYFITFFISSSIFKGKKINKIYTATIAAIIFSLCRTVWEQATWAEKYTLNMCFICLLFLILIKINANFSHKLAKLLIFLTGVSFTHHYQTSFFVAASIIVFIKYIQRLQITHFFLFFIPLLLYSYLPIRGDNIYSWGKPTDLEKIIDHLTCLPYRGLFILSGAISRLRLHLEEFFFYQCGYLIFIFIIFAIVGAVVLARKNITIFVSFLLMLIANFFHTIRFTSITVIDYYMPIFFVMSVFVALGIGYVLNKLYKLNIFLLIAFSIIPLFLFIRNFNYTNYRNYYYAYDYGKNLIKSVEQDAVILIDGDIFPVWYITDVERYRVDVLPIWVSSLADETYISKLKQMRNDVVFNLSKLYKKQFTVEELENIKQRRLIKIIDDNVENLPIYAPDNEKIHKKYYLLPVNFYYRIIPDKKPNKEKIYFLLRKTESIFDCRNLANKDETAQECINNYVIIYNKRAEVYYQLNKIEAAISELIKAIKINKDDIFSLFNLARMYERIEKYDEAVNLYKKILTKKAKSKEEQEVLQLAEYYLKNINLNY